MDLNEYEKKLLEVMDPNVKKFLKPWLENKLTDTLKKLYEVREMGIRFRPMIHKSFIMGNPYTARVIAFGKDVPDNVPDGVFRVLFPMSCPYEHDTNYDLFKNIWKSIYDFIFAEIAGMDIELAYVTPDAAQTNYVAGYDKLITNAYLGELWWWYDGIKHEREKSSFYEATKSKWYNSKDKLYELTGIRYDI